MVRRTLLGCDRWSIRVSTSSVSRGPNGSAGCAACRGGRAAATPADELDLVDGRPSGLARAPGLGRSAGRASEVEPGLDSSPNGAPGSTPVARRHVGGLARASSAVADPFLDTLTTDDARGAAPPRRPSRPPRRRLAAPADHLPLLVAHRRGVGGPPDPRPQAAGPVRRATSKAWRRTARRADAAARPAPRLSPAAAARQVVVPEQARGHGAPGPPRLTDRAELVGTGPMAESLDLADRLRERDVADRPHIGPPEDHQQVDRRRPAADAGDRLELDADDVVIEGGQPLEVERSRSRSRVGQRPAVAGLLPAEADREQLGVGEREEARRASSGSAAAVEPVERRLRRRERDLLLEDDVEERPEPGRPVPQRRRPVTRDDPGEVRRPARRARRPRRSRPASSSGRTGSIRRPSRPP